VHPLMTGWRTEARVPIHRNRLRKWSVSHPAGKLSVLPFPGAGARASRFVLTGDARASRPGVVALGCPDFPDGSLLLQRASCHGHSDGL